MVAIITRLRLHCQEDSSRIHLLVLSIDSDQAMPHNQTSSLVKLSYTGAVWTWDRGRDISALQSLDLRSTLSNGASLENTPFNGGELRRRDGRRGEA